jgi:phage protein
MKKPELIKRIEVLPYTEGPIADTITINRNWILESIEQLDEPEMGHADEAPRYVKNILARLRELPLHDREVWLKAIMGEFEQDFSHAKWREGYEQGKLEGMVEREKFIVPQMVAEWIKKCKTFKNFAVSLSFALQPNVWEANGLSHECIEWLADAENQETFARAWLDGYDIQETKYVVTDGNHLYFKNYQEDIEIVILVDEQPGTMEYVKKFDTKKEAQKAADILGWKVQEVEE